ncbi:MAG: 50S ribosomal protein L22 [Pyrinomonadaceae bacterium]
MEAIAKGKFLRGSPQKARLVIDMIRGKNVAQALAILQFTNKRATENIEKCLRSAIANATFKAEQDNIAIDPDDLWVKTCFVDMGPTKNRRRVRPAPQGRAYREQRYYCHITMMVTSDKPVNTKEAKSNAVAKDKTRPVGKKLAAKNAPVTASEKAKKAPKKDAAPAAETIEENVIAAPPTEQQLDATVTEAPIESAVNEKTPAKNETESTAEEKKTD